MVSTRCLGLVCALTLGTLAQVVIAAGPASTAVDRAEVERVRAGIRGRTIIVDWHGTWDYATIQAALDASTNGDTIIVLPSAGSPDGGYVENVVFPARAVTLRSINPDDPGIVAATVIDGNDSGSVVRFAEGTPASAALEGFTITNGSGTPSQSSTYGGGLYLYYSSPTIANNTITGNSAGGRGGGLYLYYSSPTIANNKITNGDAYDGGGLYLDYSSPTIVNNVITGNGTYYRGGGLYLYHSSPTITNNTITGNNAGSWGGGLYLSSSSPVITGNKITNNNTGSGGGGGLYLGYSSPTVANNTITGNSSGCGGGLYLQNYSSPTIANNAITINSAFEYGGGLYVSSYSSPIVANNTITGNSADDGGGLWVYEHASPTIRNTVVAFNSSGVCSTGAGSSPTLRHNCVYGNTAYNYSGLRDPTGTNGNISVDPRLAGVQYGNIHVQPDSPCVDAGDSAPVAADIDIDGQPRIQPVGGTVDIGADESDGTVWPGGPEVIVRVCPQGDDAHDGSSWALAKRTVQAGIDTAAALGGEVWVQTGTYYERITLRPYTHVYGGFVGGETERDQRDWSVNVTTLDGQQQGTVVTARNGHRVSAIDGFTITNGSADYGGGLALSYCGSTVANNTITGNSAYGGGGLCLSDCSPIITGNTISGNSAGSWGGGLCVSYDSSPTIANNQITGNSASTGGGGLYLVHAAPTITGNTITGNSAGEGGGLYLGYSSSPTITNTIVAFNASGVYRIEGSLALRHNCVHGNTAYDFSGLADPTGTFGNISADPWFVQDPNPGPDGTWGTGDDEHGDLHLLAESPCINAGDNAYALGDNDLDGNPRWVGCFVDMGAYEYQEVLPVRADFDVDCDVDLDDYLIFEICLVLSGPDEEPPFQECLEVFDFDLDADVDMHDFRVFQREFTSPLP